MSSFKQLAEDADRFTPPVTLVVGVHFFCPTWVDRPKEDVCCGLRPLAGTDDEFCRREAARFAWQTWPGKPDDEHDANRVDSFNDALMRFAVVRGTCDPNDSRRGWGAWHGVGEEIVKEALTREGVKALFDAVERTTLATSPVLAEASDADLAELAELALKALALMPPARRARARRLFTFLLDECAAFVPPPK